MPMPTTRLNTTMAVSKVESRARMGLKSGSAATQCLFEPARKLPELIQIVVQLRRDTQQRPGMGGEPGFDAAFAEPPVQPIAIEPVSLGTNRGPRQPHGCHRSNQPPAPGRVYSRGC